MTDQELIELVQTKAPEELTLAEIDQLRRRLPHSAELQEAFSSRLEMDRYLADALGLAEVSVDEIIARAGNAPALRTNGVLPLVGWMLCILLIGFVGLMLI